MQDCHQIREFRENQGFLYSIREYPGERKIFQKFRDNQGRCQFCFGLLQGKNFFILNHTSS